MWENPIQNMPFWSILECFYRTRFMVISGMVLWMFMALGLPHYTVYVSSIRSHNQHPAMTGYHPSGIRGGWYLGRTRSPENTEEEEAFGGQRTALGDDVRLQGAYGGWLDFPFLFWEDIMVSSCFYPQYLPQWNCHKLGLTNLPLLD